jgi:hypothetical protein
VKESWPACEGRTVSGRTRSVWVGGDVGWGGGRDMVGLGALGARGRRGSARCALRARGAEAGGEGWCGRGTRLTCAVLGLLAATERRREAGIRALLAALLLRVGGRLVATGRER